MKNTGLERSINALTSHLSTFYNNVNNNVQKSNNEFKDLIQESLSKCTSPLVSPRLKRKAIENLEINNSNSENEQDLSNICIKFYKNLILSNKFFKFILT